MSTSITKRACDACHRRKVRCNGSNPCENCTGAGLTCTFNKPPQKKGPKGSRAKIILELRQHQKLMALKTGGPREDGVGAGSTSPTLTRTPSLFTLELIEKCTGIYLSFLYPTVPVLHRNQINHHVGKMNSSIESYCLIGSLCAWICIQPGLRQDDGTQSLDSEETQERHPRGSSLVEEVVKVRKTYNPIENPTVITVVTGFLLSASYFGLEKHNLAWFYLREAITLAQITGMGDETTYVGDDIDSRMQRQLFWMLFVADRAYVLHNHRPLTLHATISFPTPSSPPQTAPLSGLLQLVDLFRIIDDDFARVWSTARSQCSAAWLLKLQTHLTEVFSSNNDCTEIQRVDLMVTQQWLRIIVWQLATASSCLSSQPVDESMTFTYPITVSHAVVLATSGLPPQSMEVHGLGFVEKLFDVACTLVDVMALVPMDTPTQEAETRGCLEHLILLITTLRGGRSRYVGLLNAKIRDTIPEIAASLASPVLALLLTPPQTTAASCSDASSASTPFGSPPLRGGTVGSHPLMSPLEIDGFVAALSSAASVTSGSMTSAPMMGSGPNTPVKAEYPDYLLYDGDAYGSPL